MYNFHITKKTHSSNHGFFIKVVCSQTRIGKKHEKTKSDHGPSDVGQPVVIFQL